MSLSVCLSADTAIKMGNGNANESSLIRVRACVSPCDCVCVCVDSAELASGWTGSVGTQICFVSSWKFSACYLLLRSHCLPANQSNAAWMCGCNLIKLKGSQSIFIQLYTNSHTHVCVDIGIEMRRQLQLKCISCCLPVSCGGNSNWNTSYCMYLQFHRHLPSTAPSASPPSPPPAFPFPC